MSVEKFDIRERVDDYDLESYLKAIAGRITRKVQGWVRPQENVQPTKQKLVRPVEQS